LEKQKQTQAGSDFTKVLDQVNCITGVPLMLGYKVNKQVGEIMMTHNGNCIDKWMG
jgi:hypothetical protein